MEAASDSTALSRAANNTLTVARGKVFRRDSCACGVKHARTFLTNSTRSQSVKYRSCTESTINNCSTPTLGFGKVLDSSLPYFWRHPFAWPASLQIILKNDAKWSISEPRRDILSQRFLNDDRSSFHAIYLKHSKIAIFTNREWLLTFLSAVQWLTGWR